MSVSLTNISFAYNLKQITNNENLTNSSITTFCQDKMGIMWIGTCDGINIYNGRDVIPYISTTDMGYLSGNFIGKLLSTDDNRYWIQTHYGLSIYNANTNKLSQHNEFKNRYFLETDKNNNILIIQKDNYIFYNYKNSDTFKQIYLPGLIFSDIINFFTDNFNNIWIVTKNGLCFCYKISANDATGELKITPNQKYNKLNKHLLYSYFDDNCINYVDEDYNLFCYNLKTENNQFISNIAKEINSRGKISSIVKCNDKFFIGFLMGGLIRLEKINKEYITTEIDVNCGVFCLKKDRFQDILWIGTDGQGVYLYSEPSFSIKSTILNNLTYKMGRPIRAIILDKEKNLWIGSKGDGILKIHNYNENSNISNCDVEKYTTSNSSLTSDAVYCFASSKRDILWIGTEEGLNYYSFKEKKLKRLNININGLSYKYIHDIYEDKNSNIWIATVGMGIIKAHLEGTNNDPILNKIIHYSSTNNNFELNYFYSLYPENDSIIWFANKGYGPYKFNINKESLDQFNINDLKLNTINDISSIIKDNSGNYYFGTCNGLMQFNKSHQLKLYNTSTGFLNNTVHSILKGKNNDIWISTNKGIINFNPEKKSFRQFFNEYGQKIIEFSDGASYRDELTGTLYFGGINGFVTIIEKNNIDLKHMPPIYFDNLTIFGEKCNINEFRAETKNTSPIDLNHDQNFFSISFNAIDYLNGNNYTYFYKLSGLKDKWINNGHSNTASFTNISPGKYSLQVKYYNRTVEKESEVYTIVFNINYPWYRTFYAFCIYFALSIFVILLIFRHTILQIKHNELTRISELEKKHQKEVFESKLDFFTNITHEFCAPLSLISGPCERILIEQNISEMVKNYAHMIKTNANRLNSLIQELIEFRKIETENRSLQIESLQISTLVSETIEAFEVMAESSKIEFKTIYLPSIIWNCDKGFLISIIINLLSNAFKYTTDGKKIRFELSIENMNLVIKVANEGKINNKDFDRIFDRHVILENFEKREGNQTFSRTGLGLAISSNMVKLLNGTISVENTTENWVLFKVVLPEMKIQNQHSLQQNIPRYIPSIDIPWKINNEDIYDRKKPTILFIDDDEEMLWFLSELFTNQFNTIRLKDATYIDKILNEFHPDLIISDIWMPCVNGIELTKKIKNNKDTNHIPIILISANHEIEHQIMALSLGVEMYITKPFNTELLKISVNQLFERREQFKNYFSSPISSFDLTEGKLTHKEHKKFLQSVLTIINDNITNPDLSIQFIADKLSMGARSLSRKMEDIGEQSPTILIRESRLFFAHNLLIKTTMTIDEIVYKSGYSNKVTFFKAFSSKFNCTPKEYRNKNIDSLNKY